MRAGQIEPGILQRDVVLRFRGLGLRKSCPRGLRVDFGEKVAGVNILAIGEVELDQRAVDPAGNGHAVQWRDRTEADERNRHVGPARHIRDHGNGIVRGECRNDCREHSQAKQA